MIQPSIALRKIMVLIDFSELSSYAFTVALQLARKSKAQVKLLHVVALPVASGYGASYSGIEMNPVGAYQNYDFMLPELLEQSKQQMEQLAHAGLAAGITVEQEITADRMVSKLMSVVTGEQIDLVVLGSEGVAGLEEFLIGSDAEEVVRYCPCPVLTIKQPHELFEVKQILFPLDFASETTAIMPYVTFFQQFFGARLHLLYVQTKNNQLSSSELQNQMTAFVAENNLREVTVLVQSNSSASAGIMAAVRSAPPDLILVPTHGRTGLAHLFHKSVAESVVNHATIPVLTFHWPPGDAH